MKHLVIFETYSTKDLDDLMGDLDSIGQVKKVVVDCTVITCFPEKKSHPTWWDIFPQTFASVEIADRGEDWQNYKVALEMIQEGKFSQMVEYPGISGLDITKNVLSKNSIQQIANQTQSLEFFSSKVRDKVLDVIASEWGTMIETEVSKLSPEDFDEFFQGWRESPRRVKEEIGQLVSQEITINPK